MFYIVRHGETKSNKQKLLQGRTNAPLNDVGRMQAEQIREYFEEQKIVIDVVYSSPLIRSVETAQIICGLDTEIITDDHLLEIDYGPYEGVPLDQRPRELMEFFADFIHAKPPKGMESLQQVQERAGAFIHSIAPMEMERNVLISCHAVSMKGLLESVDPEAKGKYWPKHIGNCGLFCFEFDGQKFSMPEELNNN